MTREAFLLLAGALYDAHTAGGTPGTTGAASRSAGSGTAPKYDTKIFRKGGMCQYASELDLSSLVYWREQCSRPDQDPKYADSNAKQAKALDYFIAWRRANPDAIWKGERNRILVIACEPLDGKDARQYPKDALPGGADETPSDEPDFNDDDIPF